MKLTTIKALLGIFLIVLSLASLVVFREQTMVPLVYLILVVVLSIGAAILANFISGEASYDKKPFYATKGFLVFGIILVIGYWYFQILEPFTFTIKLVNKKGIPIRMSGKLYLMADNEVKHGFIVPENGTVDFKELPTRLNGKKVAIFFDNNVDDWVFLNDTSADSVVLIGTSAVIRLQPTPYLRKIRGQFTFQSGKPITGVKVWIDNLKPLFSDSLGNFEINLPEHEQSVKLFKVEYQYKNINSFEQISPLNKPTIKLKY